MPTEICQRQYKTNKTRFGPIDLGEANRQLAKLSPIERVNWARDRFGEDNLILTTSFGPSSPILLKLATAVMPDIPAINIRHGYETPATEKISRTYRDEFFLNLHVFDAPRLRVPREGTPEFAEFKRQIKAEPFQRARDQFQPAAYFSGVMRWQSPERHSRCFIEDKGSVLAINPLLDMTPENVEQFFLATGLPRNRDYYDPAKGAHQGGECGLNTSKYN